LDALGLNQNFGLVPLAEIQSRSSAYQAMLQEPQNDLWAAGSFKHAIVSERIDHFKSNWKLDQAYKNAIRQQEEMRLEREQAMAERDELQTKLADIYNNWFYKMISKIQETFRQARVRWVTHQTPIAPSKGPETHLFTPSDNQEFDLDEIMEKIRAEVTRRNSAQQQLLLLENNFIQYNRQQTKVFRLVKGIQTWLQKFYLYDSIYKIAYRFKKYIPKYETKGFPIAELLKFDDDIFIKNAYKVILHRDPDSTGMHHYLSKLRSNALSKAEILARLRYSAEGKRVRTKIEGLSIWIFIRSIF
jgi:hypothetical protein